MNTAGTVQCACSHLRLLAHLLREFLLMERAERGCESARHLSRTANTTPSKREYVYVCVMLAFSIDMHSCNEGLPV